MATSKISQAFAKQHGVVVLAEEALAVHVATAPTVALEGLTEIRRLYAKPLRHEAVSADRFAQLVALSFSEGSSAARSSTQLTLTHADSAHQISEAGDAPAVQAVNQLFVQALAQGASDIHLEPEEGLLRVRFRIDGRLQPQPDLHGDMQTRAVARLKVMARLDLAERRLPQDGRMSVRLASEAAGGKAVDVRISTLPAIHGERVVMRILDRGQVALDLPALGMSEPMREELSRLLALPHGIVLVTGPTGSGKTTTLYAMLTRLATTATNLMTVEDPVEYALPGVAQTAVNPAIGLTFERALRSILRQDPDVLMIGEVRDRETAQIAVQAALTGHLVLATLHTNDAASAVTRLADMGIEPYLLASSLSGVLAQRLVRRLCNACKSAEPATADEAALFEALSGTRLSQGASLYRAVGCAACRNSGYRGRVGLFELLPVDAALRQAVHSGASVQDLQAHIVPTLSWRSDVARHVGEGATTLAEAALALGQ